MKRRHTQLVLIPDDGNLGGCRQSGDIEAVAKGDTIPQQPASRTWEVSGSGDWGGGIREEYPGLNPAQGSREANPCAAAYDAGGRVDVNLLRAESRHFLEYALTMREDRLARFAMAVIRHIVESGE